MFIESRDLLGKYIMTTHDKPEIVFIISEHKISPDGFYSYEAKCIKSYRKELIGEITPFYLRKDKNDWIIISDDELMLELL